MKCHVCKLWFETDIEDVTICPQCHGEWVNQMQEEMRREPPEDFCVEEMLETQFPHLNPFLREDYPATSSAIDDWFKRCMAKFPVDTYVPTDKERVVRIVTPEYEEVECWFEKWFSQFIEKDEDENV